MVFGHQARSCPKQKRMDKNVVFIKDMADFLRACSARNDDRFFLFSGLAKSARQEKAGRGKTLE
jgi:hypothetical protein